MVDANSFRLCYSNPLVIVLLLFATVLPGCTTPTPSTGRADSDGCTPPPYVIVTQTHTFRVCVAGDMAKITNAKGELLYQVRPNAIAAMGGNVIKAMTLQYELCQAIRRGDVPRGDLAAYDKFTDIQVKILNADQGEQSAAESQTLTPEQIAQLPACQGP